MRAALLYRIVLALFVNSEGHTRSRAGWFGFIKAALRGDTKDFTSGSINGALITLSIPMVLEMMMESLFAVVDVFYVSRISTEAIATVGVTESVMMIIYSIAVGMSMSATAFVARRTGEKKLGEAAEAAVQALYLALFFSIPLSIGGIIFAPQIMSLIGAAPEVVQQGSNYMRIMLGGNCVVMFLFLNNAIFRGAGDAALAMRALWLANALNIILSPIFIFGFGPIPAMGVTGAAVGTTLGRGLGALYQFRMLSNGRSLIQITARELAIRPAIIWEMFKVSLGGMGQFLIHSASWIFLVRILAKFGSGAVAGYTIAIRIIVFTILPSWGLASAAATLVGQNLGAGHPERAEKSVWTAAFYNMLFLATVSVIFFAAAKPLLSVFSKDPEAISNGVRCLRIICLGYVLFAYGMIISQAFNGAGDTKTPTLINVVSFWIVQIPLAYVLAWTFKFGTTGVYTAQAVSFCVEALLGIWIFRKGRWKTVKV